MHRCVTVRQHPRPQIYIQEACSLFCTVVLLWEWAVSGLWYKRPMGTHHDPFVSKALEGVVPFRIGQIIFAVCIMLWLYHSPMHTRYEFSRWIVVFMLLIETMAFVGPLC